MSKYLFFFILFASFSAEAMKPSVTENVLRVKPYARVYDQTQITLYDIVDRSLLSERQQIGLKKVVLGSAPALGEKRLFNDTVVASAMRSAMNTRGFQIQIPRTVVVENKGYELDRATVEEELLAQWKTLCTQCEFQILNLQLPAIPSTHTQYPWALSPEDKLPRGSFAQKIKVQEPSGRQAIYYINGQLEIRKSVPVLIRSTPIHTRFTEDDIKFEVRNVTMATDTIPTTKEIIGQKAKYTMNANDIIWHGSLVREKAVQRGEIVKVRVGEKNWEISIQAKTEQEGYIGDTINLRNLQTNRMITGRIIGEGEVELK